MVPHLFSGVLARMLRGFPCVTAEQMVEELLMDWQEELGQGELGQAEELEVGGGGYVMPADSEVEEELQLEAGEALEEGEVVEELEDTEEDELVEELEDTEEEELVEELEVDEVVVSQWRRRVRQLSIIHSNVTLEAEVGTLQYGLGWIESSSRRAFSFWLLLIAVGLNPKKGGTYFIIKDNV